MDNQKAKAIIELATGMKRSEWNCIVCAVEKKFRDAEARLIITEEIAQGALDLISLEATNE